MALSLCAAVAAVGLVAPAASAATYMTVSANTDAGNPYPKSVGVLNTPDGSFCKAGGRIITSFPKKAGTTITVMVFSSNDCRQGSGLASQWVDIPATVDKAVVTFYSSSAKWVQG